MLAFYLFFRFTFRVAIPYPDQIHGQHRLIKMSFPNHVIQNGNP